MATQPLCILGIGALYQDTILSMPHFPAEDSKLRAISKTTRIGGNIINMFEVLGDLSTSSPHDTRIIFSGSTGTRASCEWIEHDLRNRNIQSKLLFRADAIDRGPATATVICAQDTGSRTIISDSNGIRDPSADDLLFLLPPKAIKPDWIHLEVRNCRAAREYLEACFAAAAAHGAGESRRPVVSIDLEKVRDGDDLLLECADVVFVSSTYATDITSALTLPTACDPGVNVDDELELLVLRLFGALRKRRLQDHAVVYYTVGEKGCYVIAPKSRSGSPAVDSTVELLAEACHYQMVDAVEVEKKSIVETVGAGDVFQAAVLHKLITLKADQTQDTSRQGGLRAEWIAAAQTGNRMAAQKIQQHGFQGVWKKLEETG